MTDKIDRFNGEVKAFASEYQGTERTTFGTINTSNELTDQQTSGYLRGWGIVGANEDPALEDFNAAMYTATQYIAYLHQMGIPEWNAAQEYPTVGAACVHDGFLWLRTGDWTLTDEPTFVSGSWYLNHPVFQWTVSQLADGDKSKVAFIKEGVTIGSYEWMIWPATGQVFDVNGASGTFAGDFDPATGVDSGISDGPLLEFSTVDKINDLRTRREVILSFGQYTAGTFLYPNSRSQSDYESIEIHCGSTSDSGLSRGFEKITQEHIAENNANWNVTSAHGSTSLNIEIQVQYATDSSFEILGSTGTGCVKQIVGYLKEGV